ncbi:MAG: TIGR02452 family protein [Deltaproteobacteria bacterium]|nr:TIGR02452 family protein [Deltaproteobacteria bacterium]
MLRGRMTSYLPVRDTPELAEHNRRKLDISRSDAVRIAAENVRICADGQYRAPSGSIVDLRPCVEEARTRKLSIPAETGLPSSTAQGWDTLVEVANETTDRAAQRLQLSCTKVLALNFANGTTPGGGFLVGARAQEESLCRMSALYATLDGDAMYEFHRAHDPITSSAWAILSPAVPFFRGPWAELLETPWFLDVLTCAAPIASRGNGMVARSLLSARIGRVLEIARAYEYEGLVLGAWGCGAFGNDSATTAEDFHRALTGRFDGVFRSICLAITDWSDERRFLGPFRDRFR